MLKQFPLVLLFIVGLISSGCSRAIPSSTPSNTKIAQTIVDGVTGNARGSRNQARVLRAESDKRLAAKDYNGAMDKRLQMLVVRGKDPSTFGALTADAIQQLAISDLSAVASHLDAPACRKYAAQLKAMDAQMPTYPAMLQSQKADAIKQFKSYSSDPKKWARLIAGLGRNPQEQKSLDNASTPQIEANIETAYNALIQKANQPYSWAPIVVSVDPYTRNYAMPYAPDMAQYQWTKNKLDRLFAIVALQQRADRLDKKARTIPLPRDPFGTGPLKEKIGVIYSVGPDRKDNGGRPMSKPQYPKASDPGDIPAPTF